MTEQGDYLTSWLRLVDGNPSLYGSRVWTQKQKARQQATAALKKGLFTKPNKCSFCNQEKKIEMHHPDYNKPLEVEFLCVSCHKGLHRKAG